MSQHPIPEILQPIHQLAAGQQSLVEDERKRLCHSIRLAEPSADCKRLPPSFGWIERRPLRCGSGSAGRTETSLGAAVPPAPAPAVWNQPDLRPFLPINDF